MSVQRFFYVTQDDLVVWHRQRGRFVATSRFATDDAGRHDFSLYLRNEPHLLSVVVVDVIEEEFSVDSVPRLPRRDRTALIDRRLARKYSRTPYRMGHFQGSPRSGEDAESVLYSAISNDELLAPWLSVMGTHKTPLAGIHSVPLMAAKLLSTIRKPAGNAMLLSHHQGNRVRVVYLRDGKVKSARLSQSPDPQDDRYGQHIFAEILRSRRYLERSRLINGAEEIDVYMITDSPTAERIIASDEGRLPLYFHFISAAGAAKALRLAEPPPIDRLEVLYLALAARGRMGQGYALQGETRYHTLSRARQLLITGTVAASLAGSALAGINFMNGYELREATARLDSQIEQMTKTFRREQGEFAPVRANSHDMKLAVDTGDYILANRLPGGWVMEQLGQVLTEFPQVQVDELSWKANTSADAPEVQNSARRADVVQAVDVGSLRAIEAQVTGQLLPFDGNYRNAFTLIEEFKNALQARTDFGQVRVTELPLDAKPRSSVSGGFAADETQRIAGFSLSLTLDIVSLQANRVGDNR